MSPLVSAELLKQRTTRLVPVTLAAALAFALFILRQVIETAGVRGAPSLGTIAHTRQILGIPVVMSVVLLILGVMVVTTEGRHGTATSTYLAEPRRHRVVAAKALGALLVSAIWTVLTVLVVHGIATPWLAHLGVDHLANLSGLRTTLVALLLVLPLYALMGVGVGAIARNQVAAVLVPVMWLLVLEPNVVAPRLGSLARWLPNVATQIAGGAPHAPAGSWWAGVLTLAVWALGLLAVGTYLTTRRDVR